MAEELGEPSDGMTQPSREKPQWGKKLSQKRKAAGRWCKEWMGRLPLFAAIAIWAVLGIIAFLLAMWWLGRVPFWQLKLDPRKHAENIVKIALTLVGGVGAVAYLVIKYQERQQAGRAENARRTVSSTRRCRTPSTNWVPTRPPRVSRASTRWRTSRTDTRTRIGSVWWISCAAICDPTGRHMRLTGRGSPSGTPPAISSNP